MSPSNYVSRTYAKAEVSGSRKSDGMPMGAIAAIAIGVGLIILACGITFCFIMRRNQKYIRHGDVMHMQASEFENYSPGMNQHVREGSMPDHSIFTNDNAS